MSSTTSIPQTDKIELIKQQLNRSNSLMHSTELSPIESKPLHEQFGRRSDGKPAADDSSPTSITSSSGSSSHKMLNNLTRSHSEDPMQTVNNMAKKLSSDEKVENIIEEQKIDET